MKYYCIGIKGTGMSTLAQILNDLGHKVSGYDDCLDHKFTQDGLEDRNIPIYYDGNHELDSDTIVTYSAAFSENHPEIQRVRALGLVVKKYNEIMGDIISMFDSIGVSGTHGKTTTSSLIRHILEADCGCNYFIGAGDGYAMKENDYFVVESDEFNRQFTAYKPKYSVITNIEAEHLECYKDIDDIRDTFEIFANQTKKLVVANGDNEQVRKINYKTPVKFYGFDESNDVVIKNMQLLESGSVFDLYIDGELFGHFDLPLFGKHMLLNALAVIAVCHYERLDAKEVSKSLKTFKGAERRFKETFIGNNVIVDDYAHHPAEVKVTIKAARQKYPDKKIIAVFKAHTFSRVEEFSEEFASALNLADKAYVMDINYDRENPLDYPGIDAYTIIDKLDNGDYIEQGMSDKLLDYDNAVILFMSSKEIYLLEEEYIKKLEERIKDTNN